MAWKGTGPAGKRRVSVVYHRRYFPIWQYREVFDPWAGSHTGEWAWQANPWGRWEFGSWKEADQYLDEYNRPKNPRTGAAWEWLCEQRHSATRERAERPGAAERDARVAAERARKLEERRVHPLDYEDAMEHRVPGSFEHGKKR